MNPSSTNLPRPSYSATFPSHLGSATTASTGSTRSAALPADGSSEVSPAEKLTHLAERGTAFVKAHWKQIGLGALALLGMRSARLRPLLRKAAMFYALPMAKNALVRAVRR